jgi:hypothetical protein
VSCRKSGKYLPDLWDSSQKLHQAAWDRDAALTTLWGLARAFRLVDSHEESRRHCPRACRGWTVEAVMRSNANNASGQIML